MGNFDTLLIILIILTFFIPVDKDRESGENGKWRKRHITRTSRMTKYGLRRKK